MSQATSNELTATSVGCLARLERQYPTINRAVLLEKLRAAILQQRRLDEFMAEHEPAAKTWKQQSESLTDRLRSVQAAIDTLWKEIPASGFGDREQADLIVRLLACREELTRSLSERAAAARLAARLIAERIQMRDLGRPPKYHVIDKCFAGLLDNLVQTVPDMLKKECLEYVTALGQTSAVPVKSAAALEKRIDRVRDERVFTREELELALYPDVGNDSGQSAPDILEFARALAHGVRVTPTSSGFEQWTARTELVYERLFAPRSKQRVPSE